MKITKILMLFFVAISIVSCKSDDDNNVDPTIDTDGDGVADINDLCPNLPGTILDDGCYYLTNVNMAGIHDLNFLTGNVETIEIIGGVEFPVSTTIVGDTFQVEATFNENGTFTFIGEYRLVTTITVGGISNEDSQIFPVNENGTYQVSEENQTLTLNGVDDIIDGVFDVTLFNQEELRLIKEETTTENDITTETVIELRFTR